MGLQKSKKLNLDVRNIISGSHTEHEWGCSKSHTEKYIQITVCDQKSSDHTAIEANKSGKAHPICRSGRACSSSADFQQHFFNLPTCRLKKCNQLILKRPGSWSP
jgi:hypothetical protein